jgi:superfamily I DNA/RNA helicase
MKQPSLFDDDAGAHPAATAPAPERAPDQDARDFAIAPENDVVLEASAGTGKTRVLVDRYVRLIEKGVEPRHILAITFTRKAAAEMRERVLAALVRRAGEGGIDPKRWHALRQRISDIQISTIDAFCFSLLREFPLEAGVEPGFDIADETEMGRFAREAMERTLRISRALLPEDEALRLLFARVKGNVLRSAVEEMLDRRHIAVPAVADFVSRSRATLSAGSAGAARSRSGLGRVPLAQGRPH